MVKRKSGVKAKRDICPICKDESAEWFWVRCDGRYCKQWHHTACVGVTQSLAKRLATWFCLKCEKSGKAPPKHPSSFKPFTNRKNKFETQKVSAPKPTTNQVNTTSITCNQNWESKSYICICLNSLKTRTISACSSCSKFFDTYCIRLHTNGCNGDLQCPRCYCDESLSPTASDNKCPNNNEAVSYLDDKNEGLDQNNDMHCEASNTSSDRHSGSMHDVLAAENSLLAHQEVTFENETDCYSDDNSPATEFQLIGQSYTGTIHNVLASENPPPYPGDPIEGDTRANNEENRLPFEIQPMPACSLSSIEGKVCLSMTAGIQKSQCAPSTEKLSLSLETDKENIITENSCVETDVDESCLVAEQSFANELNRAPPSEPTEDASVASVVVKEVTTSRAMKYPLKVRKSRLSLKRKSYEHQGPAFITTVSLPHPTISPNAH